MGRGDYRTALHSGRARRTACLVEDLLTDLVGIDTEARQDSPSNARRFPDQSKENVLRLHTMLLQSLRLLVRQCQRLSGTRRVRKFQGRATFDTDAN